MKQIPILFSGPMVLALLAGLKTQTRRVVTAPKCCTVHGRSPHFDRAWVDNGPSPAGNPGPYLKLPYSGGDFGGDECVERVYPRWFVGDRLWVRETFAEIEDPDAPEHDKAIYRATHPLASDGHTPMGIVIEGACGFQWSPSIFMPRWASRITLEVIELRLERVQDISEEDAKSEGIQQSQCSGGRDGRYWCGAPHPAHGAPKQFNTPVEAFASLWDSINGGRPWKCWDDNPWVFAITFRRVEQDAKGAAA